MPDIRLIVTDLDNTLLNSAHIVTPLTDAAIRAAQAQGVLFTVATGKTFPATQGLIRDYGITSPVICANGTAVYAPDGTLLHAEAIELDYTLEALALGREANMTPVVYTGDDLLTWVWDANVDVIVAHHEPEPEVIPDLEAAIRAAGDNGRHRPYKLIFMNQDERQVEQFTEVLTARFAGRATAMRTGLAAVTELLPLGVTKGTALAYVLDYLGIAAENTLCVGDSFNDVDMMQRAAIGVAMANAPAPVRDAADFVTRSNEEDGVGHAIHQFILTTEQMKR